MITLKKKLTLVGVTAGLNKMITDLQTLLEQNATIVDNNNKTIESLQVSNSALAVESETAAIAIENISNLFKRPNS